MHGVRTVDFERKCEENMWERKSEVKEWERNSNSGVEVRKVVRIRTLPRKGSPEGVF